MDIQHAYDDWSASYDSNSNLTRDLDQQVVREALTGVRFQNILEIGCGTGKNTAFLAEIGWHIHALDFSAGMIEKARRKVRADNVRFEIADLTERWPCEDGKYHLVLCCLVLEHIEDLAHIFVEAACVLATGGNLLINELHPFRQYDGSKARFERDAVTVEVHAFVHHISDFTNTAASRGLKLVRLNEYWHAADVNKPPRIVSLYFEKRID